MSRVISQAVAPSGIACSPAGSVGSESRSRHPGALVSLIAALASLGGGFSPWAVPPALLLGASGLFHAAPAAAGVVVSNLGQTTQSGALNIFTNRNLAQGFTTGSNPKGYKLNSIGIGFKAAVGTPANLRVELWSSRFFPMFSDWEPNAAIATLTVPATVGAGTVDFAAPGGTFLAPNTLYFVIIRKTGTTTGTLKGTVSRNHDSDRRPGWSIEREGAIANSDPAETNRWIDSTRYQISVDAEVPRVVYFRQSEYLVGEGESRKVWVTIDPPLPEGTTSTVQVVAQSSRHGQKWAEEPDDYTLSGVTGSGGERTLTLPANVHNTTFTVSAVADGTPEGPGPEVAPWFLQAPPNAPYKVIQARERVHLNIVDSRALAAPPPPATASGATVWSATLTVQSYNLNTGLAVLGCRHPNQLSNAYLCSGVLTDDDFSFEGVSYSVMTLEDLPAVNQVWFALDGSIRNDLLPRDIWRYGTLVIGSRSFRLQDAVIGSVGGSPDGALDNLAKWTTTTRLGWSAGDQIPVKLVYNAPPPTSLTLSASDTAPREGGGPVTVTATLDEPAPDGLQVNVLLRGTATWGDGSEALAAGADYWTPAPAGVERGFWFGEASSDSVQAVNLLKIPAGQRSASFEVHVLDDAHEDAGETIEIEAQAYENIPSGATESWMKHLTGVSDELTLTVQNHENAETEAARLAALAAAEAEKQRLAALRAAAGGPLSGLALTAGSQAVTLVPAFSPGVTSYRAEVPAGTREVSLSPSWGAEAELRGSPSVLALSRGGATILARTQVHASGGAAALSLSPSGSTRLEVTVLEPDGSGKRFQGTTTTYRVEVVGAAVPQEEKPQTVTVAFSNVPPEHDGQTPFTVDVQSGSKPAVDAFTVTNGTVMRAWSLDPVLWRVRVEPKSWKNVKIALGEASATVTGPARIRVKDARAKEGKDASLDFAVTLNRAAAGPVTVDYATEDGTATAGADYTATSGTLTFAAGETTKTVSVTLLDDAVDEGKETFKLKLSNPQGAYLRAMHREAKGVIRNADPLPSAWQIRFGRSVSQQVVDALQQRFSSTTTPSGLQLTLAGETLTSDTPLEENHVLLSRLLGFESVSSQEVAQGSSFSFSPEGAGPRLSFWGKGALSSFNGVEESVTLTGDVTTALLGAEWNNERWRAGAALSHSWGNGSYQGEGDGADGRISSTLTGIFPYGRYALTPRLGVWATAGYGWGSLSLNPDGDAPEYNPATTMTLGAVGMDGLLLDGGSEGVTLTTTADALFLKTTSEAVVGLASSEGNISRLRLGLEATRSFTLSNGASLSPSLEVGLRQDSGDAETGFGMDLGAGLSWSAPQQGITATVKGRTLLSHGAEDFQDQGLALSFSWQPSPSNRGASLSLSHAVGLPADGGMAALLNPTAIELPDDASNGGEQFEARLAYGFPFYNNRLTLTPSVATALSNNSRSYSLLWSVAPYGEQLLGEPWELSLEGERQEHSSSPTVDHSLKLLFSLPL